MNAGLKKIMSKMGITVLESYRGAQIFQCIGLDKKASKLGIGKRWWVFLGAEGSLFSAGFGWVVVLQDEKQSNQRGHALKWPSPPLSFKSSVLCSTFTSRNVTSMVFIHHWAVLPTSHLRPEPSSPPVFGPSTRSSIVHSAEHLPPARRFCTSAVPVPVHGESEVIRRPQNAGAVNIGTSLRVLAFTIYFSVSLSLSQLNV